MLSNPLKWGPHNHYWELTPNEECRDESLIGVVGQSQNLLFYLGNVQFERNISGSLVGGYTEAVIQVYEWNVSDCTGPKTFVGSDFVSSQALNLLHTICNADASLACGGTAYSDPGTCHRPDVGVPRPSVGGVTTKCYFTEVWQRVCFSPNQGCVPWWVATGSVKVIWL